MRPESGHESSKSENEHLEAADSPRTKIRMGNVKATFIPLTGSIPWYDPLHAVEASRVRLGTVVRGFATDGEGGSLLVPCALLHRMAGRGILYIWMCHFFAIYNLIQLCLSLVTSSK